jgi:AhpD family alkylhydroperoxidase
MKERGVIKMRMLAELFPEFVQKLDEIDELYKEKRLIDEKAYQFICFALAIKARSKPCVLKHFKGALDAGATPKELAYIFALVMREAAGADDCWTHDVLGDWLDIVAGKIKCDCQK